MKIEINEWLYYLPLLVSFFWIFIYRWRHYSLGKLSKKQKAIVEKEKKKWKFFWDWKDYGLKKEPKHFKLTKTDYVMRGIFFGYLFYFLIFCPYWPPMGLVADHHMATRATPWTNQGYRGVQWDPIDIW